MKLNTKDAQILEHIIKYCTDIQMAIEHFGKEEEIFSQNPVYLNACSMPLLQIGELAKNYLLSLSAQHQVFLGDR